MSVLPTDLSDLVHCNLKTLATAEHVIKTLPNDKYTHIEEPYFTSCLGKHLRHLLDHYLCFFRDLEKGIIDYDQRHRDSQLETDRHYALGVIRTLSTSLHKLLDSRVQDCSLEVLLCSDVDFPQGEATKSSLRRELQFLQGHAVHHFALIAIMLKFYGLEVSPEFGVAPSTLVHEETVKVLA